jgi:hypothetical protein
MSDIDQENQDGAETEPQGFRHRRLGLATHALVIVGAGFLVLTTDDSTTRAVNLLVLVVAIVSVIVIAVDPAGRRRRAQER